MAELNRLRKVGKRCKADLLSSTTRLIRLAEQRVGVGVE